MHAANFRLPRQEHQQATAFIIDGIKHGLHHPRLDKFTRHKRPAPAHRHRVHAALTAQDRRIVENVGQPLAFKGRRHQKDFQRLLVTKQLTTIEAQG